MCCIKLCHKPIGNFIVTTVIHSKVEAIWCQSVLQKLQRTLSWYVCLLWALSISVGNTTGVFVNHAISSGSVTGCSASISTFFLANHSYYSTNFPRHYMRLPTLQAYSVVKMSSWRWRLHFSKLACLLGKYNLLDSHTGGTTFVGRQLKRWANRGARNKKRLRV
jgi:hypothetical protein